MDGGSTDRKFVSWRERTSIGNSEWTGNFGVRPGIREIGEEGIVRDGLRSRLREEGDRGCKPWAGGGGHEEGGGKFVDSGRPTQMGMGKNVRPADSRRKIRTGRGGDEQKWQGREELGEDEVVCRRGRQWRIREWQWGKWAELGCEGGDGGLVEDGKMAGVAGG